MKQQLSVIGDQLSVSSLKTICFLITVYCLLITVRLALAQNGEPTDDQVNAVARQLYCPVCENIPLDVCPTAACAQWRATIREKLAEGWTEDQIKSYFVEQYGERVLAQPTTRGLNLLVWVLPPLALLAGAFFLFRFLRSATASKPAPVASPTSGDEFERQLEKELAKRR
jgi:cytochrome c-type biogenesis protein CcmH